MIINKLLGAADRGWVPDSLIRVGIRHLLTERLSTSHREFDPDPDGYRRRFLARLESSRVAEKTDDANQQHYEVPPEFFLRILGPRLKYSSCYYPDPDSTLGQAEECMLALTVERAGIEDGMSILELGCGWGSLSLYMAERFPNSSITAVSNSRLQKQLIDERAQEAGLNNLQVLTQDINQLEVDERVDRIVSVEMFEHMRNYRELFRRCHGWLKPSGSLFVHIFSHRSIPYLFEDNGPANWMTRYFFSGGTMPSHDLFEYCQDCFQVDQDWIVNGSHYSRTLEDWLTQIDSNLDSVRTVFRIHYGADSEIWIQRWRMFMMACSELFAFHGGDEWRVSHYRMSPLP